MGRDSLSATVKAGRPANSHVIDSLVGLERRVDSTEVGAGGTATESGQPTQTAAQKRPTVPRLQLTTALQPQPPTGAAPACSSPRKTVSARMERSARGAAQPPKSLCQWTSLLSTVIQNGEEIGMEDERSQLPASMSLPSPCNLLDRETFRTMGIPDAIISRVYKLLQAYVVGFNGLLRDILSGQPEGRAPELIAVVWQSLLGMAEEHFKAGYGSEVGAITQRLVEQQAELHGQLQQAEKTIAMVEGQNGVMQSAMQLVRSELQQEITAKQYAQRLRDVADRKAEEYRVDAARAQADARSKSAMADGLATLPGQLLGLRYQLRQFQSAEAQQQQLEEALQAMSAEKSSTEDALAAARRAIEAERVGRADAERLMKHCQEYCDDLQTQLGENQEAIRALQASNAEALANVRSVEEVAKIDRSARKMAEASLQAEKNAHAKTHEKLLEQLKQLAAAEDRVQELRGAEMDLKQQLKQLKTSTNASRFRKSATEARLRTQEMDKAVSVEAVTRELEDMSRWKEQWRHKYKEAEDRIERMKGEAWAKAQEHKEELLAAREQIKAEHEAETQELRAEIAANEARVAALVADLTGKVEERDASLAALRIKSAQKNASLLKEVTSEQMTRQKLEREVEVLARELKAAQDMLLMVNDRAEREQAGHSADLTRARNAETEAKTELSMIKMDMERLEAELGRKSDTICEMLEGVEASRDRATRAEQSAMQLSAELAETTARLESVQQSWRTSESEMEQRFKESAADRKELKKKLWVMEKKAEEARLERESALRQLRDVAEASEARARQLEQQASEATLASKEASKGELGVQDSAFEMQMLHKEAEARLKAELREATEQMESYRGQLDEVLEREYELKRLLEEQEEEREHLYNQVLEAKLASERSAEELAEIKGQRATASEGLPSIAEKPAAAAPEEEQHARGRGRKHKAKTKVNAEPGDAQGSAEEAEGRMRSEEEVAEGHEEMEKDKDKGLPPTLDSSILSPQGQPQPSHAEREAALVARLSQQDAEQYRARAEAAKRARAESGKGSARHREYRGLQMRPKATPRSTPRSSRVIGNKSNKGVSDKKQRAQSAFTQSNPDKRGLLVRA